MNKLKLELVKEGRYSLVPVPVHVQVQVQWSGSCRCSVAQHLQQRQFQRRRSRLSSASYPWSRARTGERTLERMWEPLTRPPCPSQGLRSLLSHDFP